MTRPFVLLISIDGFADFYWRDAHVKAPTLRALAEGGAVADGVRAVFPSTTWPTHVSLVTGVTPARHGVVANHVLNRATRRAEDLTGDPIYDAAALLTAPTVYDRAAATGLKVAAVDWPATRNSPGLAFNLPFFKDQRVFQTQTSRAVWDELSAAGFPVERQGEWALLPKRFMKDTMVAEVAAHAVGDGAALGERTQRRRLHARVAPVEIGEAVDRDQQHEWACHRFSIAVPQPSWTAPTDVATRTRCSIAGGWTIAETGASMTQVTRHGGRMLSAGSDLETWILLPGNSDLSERIRSFADRSVLATKCRSI